MTIVPMARSFFKLFLTLALLLGGLVITITFAYLTIQSGRAEDTSPTTVTIPALAETGHQVTIIEPDAQYVLFTNAETVSGVLREAGVILGPQDRVEPPVSTPLQPDMRITIHRPVPLTIRVDGQVLQRQVAVSSVREALSVSGVILGTEDYTRPELDAVIQPGMSIEVVRITESFIEEDVPLPYDTVWEPTETLELDTEGLLTAGEAGILRRRYLVRYENGEEINRTFTEEWVVQEPVSEVMGYGTNIVIRVLDTRDGPLPYWRKVTMRVTSYTASSSGRPPDHPLYGVTASGYQAQTGIVAVDLNVIPFRSWVYVPGYGLGYAGDTGGGVIGRWIDLGYFEEEFVPWSGYVDVYYLTPVPDPDRINYRLPAELP